MGLKIPVSVTWAARRQRITVNIRWIFDRGRKNSLFPENLSDQVESCSLITRSEKEKLKNINAFETTELKLMDALLDNPDAAELHPAALMLLFNCWTGLSIGELQGLGTAKKILGRRTEVAGRRDQGRRLGSLPG